MSWTKLSKEEQAEARRICAKIKRQVTVSQIAKHYEDFCEYDSGVIDADELYARTGHRITP